MCVGVGRSGFFNNAGGRCGLESVYKHMAGLIPGEEVNLVYLHPTSVSKPLHDILEIALAQAQSTTGGRRGGRLA